MPQKEEPISIFIGYQGQAGATVKVDPEEVAIYYNRKGGPGKTALARKVRWEVKGVQGDDRVVVRPKEPLDKGKSGIFAYPAGKKHFEATSKEKTIVCGPPVFDVDAKFPIRWVYEAVVVRGDDEIGSHDPVVVILEDP